MANEHSIDLHLLSSQQGAQSGAPQARGGVDSSTDKFAEALKHEQQNYNKNDTNQLDRGNKSIHGQAGEVPATVLIQPAPQTIKVPATGPSPPADLTGLVNLLSESSGVNGQVLPEGGKTLPAGMNPAAMTGSLMSDKFTTAAASITTRSAADAAVTANPVIVAEPGKTHSEASLTDQSLSDRLVAGHSRLSPAGLVNVQGTRTEPMTNASLMNSSASASVVGLASALIQDKVALATNFNSGNAISEKPLTSLVPAQPVAESLHQLVSRLRLADSRTSQSEGPRTASATLVQEGQWLASGDAGRQLFAAQLASSQLAGKADGAVMQVETKLASGSQSMLSPYSLPGSALSAGVGKESPTVQFQAAMGTQFGQPAWETELGQHARMMVRENLTLAEIQLKPARLGTIEILVTQEKDQTSLMFFAKNPVVREALEAGLLRLQKSFSEDGLNLEQSQVSDQSLSEHREQQRQTSGQQESVELAGSKMGQIAEDTGSERPLVVAPEGMLDTWA